MKTILEVFQTLAGDLRIDQHLVKAINDFERGFVNQSEEHIKFFGGYSMGVHKMRFKRTDREAWFNDVMRLDPVLLEDAVADLDSIDENWVRASDVMNLSCAWLAFALKNSKTLPEKVRHEAAVQVMQVLLYKFTGSLMAHNFKFTADEASMNAMYAELSYKFAIKKAGSWGAMLRERAEELLSPSSVHRRVFEKFDNDILIIRMINDTQSRLRQIVKKMNKVFYDVRARGVKIGTTKSVLDIDGETVLVDKSRRWTSHIRYLHEVMADRNSFVKAELVEIIHDLMPTVSKHLFQETLVWMSVNQDDPKTPEVRKLTDETLIFAFEELERERRTVGQKGAGLAPLLKRLRALYMASRMANPTLILCKEMAEKLTVKATGTKSSSTIASIRTSVQLYLVLRSMAMSYYQS